MLSGGPPKDGIPAIDDPAFVSVADATALADTEPVISFNIEGEWRAYPLQVLMWHEIVNDTVGGIPVAITFCPLCNSSIVFDRRVEGQVLDFGTTGKLRFSDLVMYDRQTESWWQQFLGEAVVGDMTGKRLKIIPNRIESIARFRERAPPDAKVLVPNNPRSRAYGRNPYAGYDSRDRPYPFFEGELPTEVAPLARVITIDRSGNGTKEAWALDLLRENRRIETEDGFVISWEPGQNSAMDAGVISQGVDIGNVVVQRRETDGTLVDWPYGVDFAFAFKAFFPDQQINR
ncbi:MAG: DUF3179 domain-containing protein [Alphaproteobacteria bacterium]